MKPTIKSLKLEIAKLQDRLDKAVIFEVASGVSVGVSEEDDLWRIRREVGPYSVLFLNKIGIWENSPMEEDVLFADRTGYETSDEALDAFELYAIKNPLLLPTEQAIIDMAGVFQNIAKNN